MKVLSYPLIRNDPLAILSATSSYIRHFTYRKWLRVISLWIERSRQRQALADLDKRLLDDVGITPTDVARELAKPFWR